MNRIIQHSVRLKCSTVEAFEMFMVYEYVKIWLAQVADVEPRMGGKCELFWNPEDKVVYVCGMCNDKGEPQCGKQCQEKALGLVTSKNKVGQVVQKSREPA